MIRWITAILLLACVLQNADGGAWPIVVRKYGPVSGETPPGPADPFTPTNDQNMAGYFAYDNSATKSNRLVGGGTYTQIVSGVGGMHLKGISSSNVVYFEDFYTGLTNLTIAGWYKRTAADKGAKCTRKGVTDGTSVMVLLHENGNLYLWIGNGSDAYAYINTTYAGTDWHYIVMVYDGGAATKVVAYIDGAQRAVSTSGTFPTSIPSSSQTKMWIGGYTLADDDGTDGAYRDFLFSKRALSSNEVFQLYQYTVATNYSATWYTNQPGAYSALKLSSFSTNAVQP